MCSSPAPYTWTQPGGRPGRRLMAAVAGLQAVTLGKKPDVDGRHGGNPHHVPFPPVARMCPVFLHRTLEVALK